MIRVFVFLFISSILGVLYSNNVLCPEYEINGKSLSVKVQEYGASKVIFFILCSYMICFSGLRTTFNDTVQYISTYSYRIPNMLGALADIDWTIGANPLFEAYQIILKSLVSESGNVFIFVSALITVLLSLQFLRKYSVRFSISLFVFIAFCGYAFTMLAIKQTMATAIGIWAVSSYIENKYTRATALFLIAILIHPYVVLYLATPMLCNSIWNKRTILLLVVVIALGSSFGFLTRTLLSASAGLFGDQYDSIVFAPGTGTTVYRLFAYMICPVLSFVYREPLKEYNNSFVNLCINLSIFAAGLIFLGMFGGALVFGRLANYFDLFVCLAVSFIVYIGVEDENRRKMIRTLLILSFSFYYFIYYRKYIGGITGDPFGHITIFELLSRW